MKAQTKNTVVAQKNLRAVLAQVRVDSFAINDEELKIGLCSIAVPVRGASSNVVAALNCGAQSSRVSVGQLKNQFLPALLLP